MSNNYKHVVGKVYVKDSGPCKTYNCNKQDTKRSAHYNYLNNNKHYHIHDKFSNNICKQDWNSIEDSIKACMYNKIEELKNSVISDITDKITNNNIDDSCNRDSIEDTIMTNLNNKIEELKYSILSDISDKINNNYKYSDIIESNMCNKLEDFKYTVISDLTNKISNDTVEDRLITCMYNKIDSMYNKIEELNYAVLCDITSKSNNCENSCSTTELHIENECIIVDVIDSKGELTLINKSKQDTITFNCLEGVITSNIDLSKYTNGVIQVFNYSNKHMYNGIVTIEGCNIKYNMSNRPLVPIGCPINCSIIIKLFKICK